LSPFSIVLADDHVMFRKGLKKIITGVADFDVIGEANNGMELLEILKQIHPHLVILDISMPKLRGLEAAREIRQIYPHIKILVLTMHKKKEFVQQAMEAGAEGFLLKEDADSELLQAITALKAGKRFISPLLTSEMMDLAISKTTPDLLSNRERQVMKLLAEGKSQKEIADLLYISIFTVRNHRENIMKKLNLKNLAALIKYAIDHSYLSDDL
jgi:DNA-binding NarL/FixJ family response regulator